MSKSHLFDNTELDTIIEKEIENKFKNSDSITIDKIQYDKETYKLFFIKNMVNDMSDVMIEDTLSNLSESSKYFNYLLSRKKRRITKNLNQTLGLLKSSLLQSMEIGKELISKNNIEINDNVMNISSKESTKYLLIRIHERTMEIVGEIISLIENGFSLGARARWRSLNEYMVLTSVFTAEDDGDLSYKYLRHDTIGYKKVAEDLLSHANHKVPDYDDITQDYDGLIKTYGKDYKKEYGWYTPNPSINFIDLAIKYKSHVLIGYARESSMANHASSKDLIFQNFKSYKDLINDYEVLVQNVIINLSTINQTIMLYFMGKEGKFTASFALFMNYFGKLPQLIAELYFEERKKVDKSKPNLSEASPHNAE